MIVSGLTIIARRAGMMLATNTAARSRTGPVSQIQNGGVCGAEANPASHRETRTEHRRPATMATPASRSPAVSTCRTIRERCAPSAVRKRELTAALARELRQGASDAYRAQRQGNRRDRPDEDGGDPLRRERRSRELGFQCPHPCRRHPSTLD